ncbi:DUF1659 domain-containing protein [Alkaliphilus sp. B6464]|uniref:DUF1659 domain-containing protein n=1 Tax=Alkaliphilus sp. B6464 TaxID=2731219 RepID=UPI001BA8575A|nr:DUF1659 domain-containing protein [Alkaliphilus sp. B6464]QUH21244.1 DUF1659 domain-containing protein [Alkaliphilus sp. B6464]
MAVMKSNETRSASCRFITGLDGNGKEKIMAKAIANFKTDSTLDDVYEVALAVASLYPYSIKAVNMAERCELLE